MKTALVFGIGHFSSPLWPNLNHCINSAALVFELLTDPEIGGYDAQKSKLFVTTDELGITTVDIFREVDAAVRLLDREEELLVYFTGHGDLYKDQLFLISSDTTETNEGYRFSYLLDQLFNFDVRKAVVVVDACHSEAMFNSVNHLQNREWEPQRIGQEYGFLASAGIYQSAHPDPTLKYTLFSHYFAKALKEGVNQQTPYISLLQMTKYINQQIQLNNYQQTVHTWYRGPSDILLAKNARFDVSQHLEKYHDASERLRFDESISSIWEVDYGKTLVDCGQFAKNGLQILLCTSEGEILRVDSRNGSIISTCSFNFSPSSFTVSKSGNIAFIVEGLNLWRCDLRTSEASWIKIDIPLKSRNVLTSVLLGSTYRESIDKIYILGANEDKNVVACACSKYAYEVFANRYRESTYYTAVETAICILDFEDGQMLDVATVPKGKRVVASDNLAFFAACSEGKTGVEYYGQRPTGHGNSVGPIHNNRSGIWPFNKKRRASCVSLSSTGEYLAAAFPRHVEVVDVAKGTQVSTINTMTEVEDLVFSPDSDVVVCIQNDRNVASFWSTADGRFLKSMDHVRSARFSLDQRYLLTASQDNKVKLWGSFQK